MTYTNNVLPFPAPSEFHVGRLFTGHGIEDACPCPQEPCGLVPTNSIKEDCPEHGWTAAKTIRQGHIAEDCDKYWESKVKDEDD